MKPAETLQLSWFSMSNHALCNHHREPTHSSYEMCRLIPGCPGTYHQWWSRNIRHPTPLRRPSQGWSDFYLCSSSTGPCFRPNDPKLLRGFLCSLYGGHDDSSFACSHDAKKGVQLAQWVTGKTSALCLNRLTASFQATTLILQSTSSW